MDAGPRFCLDVGTRKVCGLLAEGRAGSARVAAFAVAEHPGRAMRSGQVSSVERASRVVAEVKAALEAETGAKLSSAHVAVAGRDLALGRAALKLRTGHSRPLVRAELAAMELQAVREARAALDDPGARADSHCVGFQVLSCRLDGRALDEPTGHRAAEVEIEVLATFLPRAALESLLEVLRGAGLDAASLTLEPIAAVQFMVPADLRRLNLALVDVGAGTSDIAVTRDGRAEAYAMVPLAGDEITESLSEALVLDFMRAEALKRSADGGGTVPDIFGRPRSVGPGEAEAILAPARARWAKACAEAVLRLNGGSAPQAVILAGGGSLLRGAGAELAAALGMDPSRVGHRPLASQETFADLPAGLLEPWAVTPLGIAASALERRGLPFLRFDVNGTPLSALKLKPEFTAFDALAALGEGKRRFHGRPGLAVTYTFNGGERTAKGGQGSPCRVFVDGRPAVLETPLEDGATLTFIEAADGEDARPSLSEALAREGLSGGAFRLNGEERPLPVELSLDGRRVDDLSAPVPDRARLEARPDATLRAALRREGADPDGLIQRRIRVTVEGAAREILQRNYSLRLNGRDADLDAPLAPGDRVDFEPGAGFRERVRDLWGPDAPPRAVPVPERGANRVLLNGEWAPLDSIERVWMDGREVGLDEPLGDGAEVRVQRAGACRTVGEALPRLGLNPWVRSGRLRVLLNGRPAQSADALSDGDALDLGLEPARGAR